MLRLAQMVKELASAERLAARAGAENHGACVCLILPYVGAWMSGVGMSGLSSSGVSGVPRGPCGIHLLRY